ncbi:hypothetical protein GA0115246_107502 [Streptomyces sp. SolWspMP-sol7th]|nr:hypothetical protein GA0115246_107502 [Streptomyces sp. SolWspMP-sol7th]
MRSRRAGVHGGLRADAQHLVADLREQVLLAGLLHGLVDGALLRLPLAAGRLAPALLDLPGVAAGLLAGLGGGEHRLPLPFAALAAQAAQGRARGAGESDGLEQRQRVGDLVGAEHVDGGGDRALGADAQAERGEELADVHPEHEVAGRDLPAAQVGEDHGPLAVHEDRVAREPAVRDAPRLERPHLPPRVAHERVGDRVVRQRVETAAPGVLVDEHDGVGAQLGGRDEAWRVGPGRDRRVREQRLLFEGLAQCLEAAARRDGTEGQAAPGAVVEAVRLLLAVDDGHVERRAVLQPDEVLPPALGLLGVLGGARGRDGAEADVAEPGEQGAPGGAHVGRADRVERPVRDGPADEHGQHDRERRRVADDEHREGVEQQHDPQHDAPARSARHPHGGHVRDDGGEVAVHGVGEDVDGRRGTAG